MIPMRDGVKLFTSIIVPKGTRNAPILLTRTPYNAAKRTERSVSLHILATLPQGDEVFAEDGYIRVFQDVRGKYKSEGEYVMTRPVRGPLNPTQTDHVTDAYDTIEWLVKNTPESNGRVGMLGSSYEGFTVVMALLAPHPDWQGAYDQDGPTAVDTRRKLIDRVIAEKMMICGAHFPFPGAGSFAKDGSGYAFTPVKT